MVSWSGPRTGPCSTWLPVPIRTPEPYRRGSVSLPAVFRLGRAAWLSQQDVFSLGLVLFCRRFIHRPAVHTTCSLITCSLLYVCVPVSPTETCQSIPVSPKFQRLKYSRFTLETPPNHRGLWMNPR